MPPAALLAASLAILLAAAPGADQDEVAVRYRFQRLRFSPVPALDSPAGRAGTPGPSVVEQLAPFGRFTEVAPGDTVELIALRNGLDPERIRRMNLLRPDAELVPGDTILCLERYHRVVPPESVEQISSLHRVDVDIVREVNELADDEQPAPWSKLQIPCPVMHRGKLYSISRLLRRPGEDPGAEVARNFPHRVTVEEGDDWSSLARRYRTQVASLHRANPDLIASAPPGAEPTPGTEVQVALEVLFRHRASLVERVLFLEYDLQADLDDVLALNDLSSAEALADAPKVLVPIPR